MDLNQQAADLLAAYAQQREPEGGLAWAKALQQAQLDGSEASIARLDRLLDQIRTQIKPQPGDFEGNTARMNFVLTVAFYLGQYIATRAGAALNWMDRAEALRIGLFPADAPLLVSAATAACGTGNGLQWLCVVTLQVSDRLFAAEPRLTLQEYVSEQLDRIAVCALAKAQPDEHRVCREYLECFFAGKPLAGGLAWRQELEALRLDYSLASLQRIDRLLHQLRRGPLPSHEALTSRPDTVNFTLLLGYYVATTIARSGDLPLKWLDDEQSAVFRKDRPPHLVFSRVCLLGDRFHFPLTAIEPLLTDPPRGSVYDDAMDIHRHARERLVPLQRPRPAAVTPASAKQGGFIGKLLARGPGSAQSAWLPAMEEAGFFAAFAMSMLHAGGGWSLSILQPQANGKHRIVDLGSFGDEQTAQRAEALMLGNPDGLRYQISLADAHLNLATGRTDGLNLELRCYEDPELHVQLVFPYRHAQHEKGFAIHRPRLCHSSAETAQWPSLLQALYTGIDRYRFEDPAGASFRWDQLLDETI